MLLRASLSVARALVIREKAAADSTKADLTAIERHVIAIGKCVGKIEEIKTWATTIRNNGEKIEKSADCLVGDLNARVADLNKHIDCLRLDAGSGHTP